MKKGDGLDLEKLIECRDRLLEGNIPNDQPFELAVADTEENRRILDGMGYKYEEG